MGSGMGKDMFGSLYGKGVQGRAQVGSATQGKEKIIGKGNSSPQQDADIMEGLKAQLGTAGNEDFNDDNVMIPDVTSVQNTQSQSSGSRSSNSSSSTPLSQEDAADLQRRLDNLSDDQIEKVFSKMRDSIGSKLGDGIGDSNEDAMDEAIKAAKLAKASSNATPKKMPRSEALDPEVRKKYDTELNAIEEELEKIYNNPLDVWRELIKDPDKYLSDEEIKKLMAIKTCSSLVFSS